MNFDEKSISDVFFKKSLSQEVYQEVLYAKRFINIIFRTLESILCYMSNRNDLFVASLKENGFPDFKIDTPETIYNHYNNHSEKLDSSRESDYSLFIVLKILNLLVAKIPFFNWFQIFSLEFLTKNGLYYKFLGNLFQKLTFGPSSKIRSIPNHQIIMTHIITLLVNPFTISAPNQFLLDRSDQYSIDCFTKTSNNCVVFFTKFFFQSTPILATDFGPFNGDTIALISGNIIPWKRILVFLASEQSKTLDDSTNLINFYSEPKSQDSTSKIFKPNLKSSSKCENSLNSFISVLTNISSFILPRVIYENSSKSLSYFPETPVSNDTAHHISGDSTFPSQLLFATEKSFYELFLDTMLFWIDHNRLNSLSNIIKNNNSSTKFPKRKLHKTNPHSSHIEINNYSKAYRWLKHLYSKELVGILLIDGGVIEAFDPALPRSSLKSKSLRYLSILTQFGGDDVRFSILSSISNNESLIADKIWKSLVENYSIKSVFGLDKSPWDLINFSNAWELTRKNPPPQLYLSSASNFIPEYYDWPVVWFGIELVIIIAGKQLKSLKNKDFNKIFSNKTQNCEDPLQLWSSDPNGLILFSKVCRNVGLSICWLQADLLESGDSRESSFEDSHSWWDSLMSLSIKISKRLFLKDERLKWTGTENFWQINCSQLSISSIGDSIVSDKVFNDSLNSVDKKAYTDLSHLFSTSPFTLSVSELDFPNSEKYTDDESSDSDSSINYKDMVDNEDNASPNRDIVHNPITFQTSSTHLSPNESSVGRKRFFKNGRKNFFSGNKSSILSRSINVLLKMPFVIPFKERVYVFNSLIRKDLQRLREVVSKTDNGNLRFELGDFGGFRNLDSSAFISIRRGHELHDAFYTLYPLLTGNSLPSVNLHVTGHTIHPSSHRSHNPDDLIQDHDHENENEHEHEHEHEHILIDGEEFIIPSENSSGDFNDVDELSISLRSSNENRAARSRVAVRGINDDTMDHVDFPYSSFQARFLEDLYMDISINESSYSPLVKLITPSDAFKLGFRVSFMDSYGNHEMGIDGGGVYREFIELFEKSIFSQKVEYGHPFSQTKSDPPFIYPSPIKTLMLTDQIRDSASIYISACRADRTLKVLELAGALTGKSLYNERFVSTPFEFSSFFLSRWLGLPYNYEDLEQLDPALCSGLDQIINYKDIHVGEDSTCDKDEKNDSLYKTFGLDFTTTMESEDNTVVTFLLPNGHFSKNDSYEQSESLGFENNFENIHEYEAISSNDEKMDCDNDAKIPLVTSKNKYNYLQSIMDFSLNNKSVSIPQAMFLRGVYKITPPSWYRTLFCSPEELNTFLCDGSLYKSEIDIGDWKRNTVYSGKFQEEGQNHECVKMFWDIVENSLVENERRSLLRFITGSEQLPQSGFSGMDPKFCIQGIENPLTGVDSNTDETNTAPYSSLNSSLAFNPTSVTSNLFTVQDQSSSDQSLFSSAGKDDISKKKTSDENPDSGLENSIEEKELKFGRFPTVSTCANLLKLPVYTTRTALKQ
ncbi:putative E3 ubiquitin protein ligase [Smittium mucronatum]|uniref:HECT-type E3 ubiquitin transferase n=1 Tax=Smittium mucronatum TaxID=133383 RepID=A0A1R0H625_9FUNG|nr:putative E3 ubiquitin protein ligase [Smittium mucronatum]